MDEQANPNVDSDVMDVSLDQVSSEPVKEAQPTQATPEPVEQKPEPKDSQPSEIDRIKAELEQERKERREEFKRIKQSFRDTGDSVIARVRDELAKRGQIINELEQEGTLTKEEAFIKREKLRDQVESEVLATHAKERETATNSQREQAQVRVRNATANIFATSGITPQDPEYSKLPTFIPHDDPDEAIDWYRQQVENVVQQKNARVKQATAQQSVRKENAQQAAVIADTGAGGAMPPTNPERELQQLLNNMPSDPQERAKWRKRIDVLSRM